MPRTETIRNAVIPKKNVCLESCINIRDAAGFSATERGLAAEVAASFALTNEVADLLDMPRDSSLTELAAALAAHSAEIRTALAMARGKP